MGKKSLRPKMPATAAFSAKETEAMLAARENATRNTPAVIRDALLAQPIVVGDVTLPVITLGHVLLLEKINSPFTKPEKVEPSNQEVAEALFVLNTPPAEVQRLLRAGRDAFEDAVVGFATETVPLADMSAIGTALGAQLLAASSTVIGHSDSPASSGEGTGADRGEKKSAAETAPVTLPVPGHLQKQTVSGGS